ncbi:hypothetical protein [Gaiella sp.]
MPETLEELFSRAIGSFAATWDDILPQTPEPIWRANIAAVVAVLERD